MSARKQPDGKFRIVAPHKAFLCFFSDVFPSLRAAQREVDADIHRTYQQPPAAIVDVLTLRIADNLALSPEDAQSLQARLDELKTQAGVQSRLCPVCGGPVIAQAQVATVPHCLHCRWDDNELRQKWVAEALAEHERPHALREATQ